MRRNKMLKTFKMDLGGRELIAEIGEMAQLANGSVFLRYGQTNVLVTACGSRTTREGMDCFPLSCDY